MAFDKVGTAGKLLVQWNAKPDRDFFSLLANSSEPIERGSVATGCALHKLGMGGCRGRRNYFRAPQRSQGMPRGLRGQFLRRPVKHSAIVHVGDAVPALLTT